MQRPSTPPGGAAAAARSPPTPATTRRIVGDPRPVPRPPQLTTARQEENRLRSKALRDRHEAARRATGAPDPHKTSSGFVATDDIYVGGKRSHSSMTSEVPATNRDGGRQDGEIPPARKFTKYVDYNFSAMTDTKGGFLSTEDDPWNKALSGGGEAGPAREDKPKHMTAEEWERLQLIRNLKRRKEGPFEPGLSVLADEGEKKKCRECGSREIDWLWEDALKCRVCHACKDKFPEKYSLLTKTECRQDYLLTERQYPPSLPALERRS